MRAPVSENVIVSNAVDALLACTVGVSDVTYFRTYGNLGDRLINAGARRLLSGVNYTEKDVRYPGHGGSLAIIGGGGGWCKTWHDMPPLVRAIEATFDKVVVWPSSFQVDESSVKEWLLETKSTIFVRERTSFEQVAGIRDAILAPDTAFYFQFSPYSGRGNGELNAFRTDRESARQSVPRDNIDISVACADLDHWLRTIERYSLLRTDRAHVMIAGAIMGKSVHISNSNYHKVIAIAEYTLGGYLVEMDPHGDGQ
jgi:exopolysaccharide biosynthesis predicted pyruvyltransferase EpsI